jgi:type II secretion system protein H
MGRKKGFTLIEIMIVLAIISLLSLMSTPLLVNYQKTTKLRSEARLLATNLRLAQQLAITEQKIYYLNLNATTTSYQIINSETSQLIKNVQLDSEVEFGEISGFTENRIQFNSTGGVLETGYISLINSKNGTSTLQIKPSGYVEIIEQ